jgi:hypothetical protein
MAWIEVHQNLPAHRKLLRLKARLNTDAPTAMGCLVTLWLWALDAAPDGDLSALSSRELSEVCGLPLRFRKNFKESLKFSGFLDADDRIHDWEEYTGRYQANRLRQKEYQRKYRERLARKCESNVSLTLDGTIPDLTEPNRTQPNQTIPLFLLPQQQSMARVEETGNWKHFRNRDEECAEWMTLLYRTYFGTTPTTGDLELLYKLADAYTPHFGDNFAEYLELAFQQAARANVRNLSYVTGVLRSLHREEQ